MLVLVVDVRESASAEKAVQALLARFGKLDILIANAGAISPFDQSTWMVFIFFFGFDTERELEQRCTRRTQRCGGTRLR